MPITDSVMSVDKIFRPSYIITPFITAIMLDTVCCMDIALLLDARGLFACRAGLRL